MSRPDELLEHARGYATAWTAFLNTHKKHSSLLYCFLEGIDDPKYYNHRIRSIVFHNETESDFRHFTCDGKHNIIRLFELITSDTRFDNTKIAFFIDKDYDDIQDLPNNEKVYITPGYAVENFYVKDSVIERILKDEFNISEEDDEFRRTIELFQTLLTQFNDASIELNVWLCLQKQFNRSSDEKSKVHINNISNDKLFAVKLDGIEKKYSIDYLAQEFPDALLIPSDVLDSKIAEFRQVDGANNFRGKHLLYFQQKFLTLLIEDRNKKKDRKHFSSHGKVRLRISDNIISELSQYAVTPESLVRFLKNYVSIT